MNLRKYVLKIMSTEWTTTDELAEVLSAKFADRIMFKRDYMGNKKSLSQALGPTLYGLKNAGLVEDDGTEWPATKRWRRIEPKDRITVDDAAEALVRIHLARDENHAMRLLAMRTVREHRDEFTELIEEALKVSEESLKIAKKMLGLRTR